MKISISTNEFTNALKVMDKVKDSKDKKASDLLLISNGYDTQLIKTNGQTTAIYTAKNTIEEPGEILLPIETASLVKKLKEDRLILTSENIKTDRKTIAIKQPEMIEVNIRTDMPLIFSVPQQELLRMLDVSYTFATDDTRPIYKGVYFNKNETCALDGYRLSLRKTVQYNNEYSFIVNGESIQILKSILKQNSDLVNVYYFSENNTAVKFEIGDTTIIAECIQGEFIKYNSIIPEEYSNKSIVNSNDLLDELEFINAADGRSFTKLVFSNDDVITIKGNQCKEEYSEKLSQKEYKRKQEIMDEEHKEKYEAWKIKGRKGKGPVKKEARFVKLNELIPVSDITSIVNAANKLEEKEEFIIAFNPKYLIEALKQHKDKVNIEMTRSISPIVITNNRDMGLELVLPVRLPA